MSILSALFKPLPPSQYQRKPLSKGLDAIPPGAILIFSTMKPNLIQWLIQKLRGGVNRTNHAGTYWGGPQHHTIEAEAKGTVIDTLDSRIDDNTMIWIWVYKPMTDEQLAKIRTKAFSLIGTKYNYLGIAEMALGMNDTDKHDDFCSEDVVIQYAEGGIPTSSKAAGVSAPEDIQAFVRSRPDTWRLFDTLNTKENPT